MMFSRRRKPPGRSPRAPLGMFDITSALIPVASVLPRVPEYIASDVPPDQPNDERLSNLGIPLALPYKVETLAEMDARLELIVCRLTECAKANDWIVGFRWWAQQLGA